MSVINRIVEGVTGDDGRNLILREMCMQDTAADCALKGAIAAMVSCLEKADEYIQSMGAPAKSLLLKLCGINPEEFKGAELDAKYHTAMADFLTKLRQHVPELAAIDLKPDSILGMFRTTDYGYSKKVRAHG